MTALERSASPGLGPGPGSAPDPIDEYVAALAAALHGPDRAKARMVTEARDALTDGAADFAPHLGPGDAARRAIDDFGSVEEVAPAFQRELTIAQARHTARAVALTVPFLMVCWYWTTAVGQGRHLPHHAQVLAAHLGGIAAAVALLAAASLAATGVLARRLPVPDRLPLMVAWTGTTAGTTLGISALTLTAVSALAGNWLVSGVLGALTVVSHARVAASARACRQCARLPVGRPAI